MHSTREYNHAVNAMVSHHPVEKKSGLTQLGVRSIMSTAEPNHDTGNTDCKPVDTVTFDTQTVHPQQETNVLMGSVSTNPETAHIHVLAANRSRAHLLFGNKKKKKKNSSIQSPWPAESASIEEPSHDTGKTHPQTVDAVYFDTRVAHLQQESNLMVGSSVSTNSEASHSPAQAANKILAHSPFDNKKKRKKKKRSLTPPAASYVSIEEPSHDTRKTESKTIDSVRISTQVNLQQGDVSGAQRGSTMVVGFVYNSSLAWLSLGNKWNCTLCKKVMRDEDKNVHVKSTHHQLQKLLQFTPAPKERKKLRRSFLASHCSRASNPQGPLDIPGLMIVGRTEFDKFTAAATTPKYLHGRQGHSPPARQQLAFTSHGGPRIQIGTHQPKLALTRPLIGVPLSAWINSIALRTRRRYITVTFGFTAGHIHTHNSFPSGDLQSNSNIASDPETDNATKNFENSRLLVVASGHGGAALNSTGNALVTARHSTLLNHRFRRGKRCAQKQETLIHRPLSSLTRYKSSAPNSISPFETTGTTNRSGNTSAMASEYHRGYVYDENRPVNLYMSNGTKPRDKPFGWRGDWRCHVSWDPDIIVLRGNNQRLEELVWLADTASKNKNGRGFQGTPKRRGNICNNSKSSHLGDGGGGGDRLSKKRVPGTTNGGKTIYS